MAAAEAVDCRNWDEDAYRDNILRDRQNLSRTVFRTAFPPSSPNPDLIVTASSDGSVASYPLVSSPHSLFAEPSCFIQAHDGPAYDITFYDAGQSSLLLSCGDDGRIRGWSWKEILDSDQSISQGSHMKPLLDLVNPQHKGPWNALSPIPETNAIAVDDQEGSIYAATGDSRAYCWDVEKCAIKMVFKGHSDYLHSIVARKSSNQIITGSEDGTVRVWDCRSGKCLQVIDPEKDMNSKEFCPYISCIALDSSESWLAFGSGRTLSVWNLPTGECVSRISTRAPIQDITFDDFHILAVGAEPVLTRFDMNGIILSQVESVPQSAFTVSLHPSGVIAVAGYGAVVDVISPFGSHFCTFHCRATK